MTVKCHAATPQAPVAARTSPPGGAGPAKQLVPEEGAVVMHAQYNSPIGLYTDENVAEAFAGQTGGTITAVKG